MHKKISTKNSHLEQINLVIVFIHNNFSSNINIKDLAEIAGYSVFHFQRIFKEVVGINVNAYIINTRLEKASNILLYNKHKKIEEISLEYGFSTATGFSATFKKVFGITPSQWRKGEYINQKTGTSIIDVDENIIIPTPEIVKEKEISMAYMRIYGKEKTVIDIWKKFYEWAEEIDIIDESTRYFGLFHNHPSFIPYNIERYVACIGAKDLDKKGKIGKCFLKDGKFAKFKFKCKHEDIYQMMHLAYVKWLWESDYEVRDSHSYVEYKKLDNLLNNQIIECDFYMPVQLII